MEVGKYLGLVACELDALADFLDHDLYAVQFELHLLGLVREVLLQLRLFVLFVELLVALSKGFLPLKVSGEGIDDFCGLTRVKSFLGLSFNRH